MTPKPKGFAARAGHWSARHRKTAIFGWLAFIVIAFVIGGALGQKTPSEANTYDGETRRAETILADAGFPKKTGEMVLVQGGKGLEAAVDDVAHTLAQQKSVAHLTTDTVSADGRSVLVQFDLTGDPETATERVGPLLDATAQVAQRHPDLTVEQFGDASMSKQLEDAAKAEENGSMLMSFGVTLLILAFTFGALVAASVPVILAATAVLGTTGVVALFSQLLPLSDIAMPAIILIGLAVGVDYSLFYIRREREERAKGAGKLEAIDIAAATSGRAVLISGLTVMAAMAGMLLTGNTLFVSMGIATILVIAVAVIGSLTVLPAVLASLGEKLEKGRIPFIGRRQSQARESRVWGWLTDRVMRRPVLATVIAGGALVALSIPALGMETKLPGVESLDKSQPAVQTYLKVQKAFPAEADFATVVVKAKDVKAPAVQEAIAALNPSNVEVNPGGTVAKADVALRGSGVDDAALASLERLREDTIPAAFGGVDATADVTGVAAGTTDFNAVMKSKTPLVFAFVLGLAFLLMLTTFRSIVIPLKAILLNLLSVGASYGLLTLVFGDTAITSWLPLFLFVILFGLSMDYHVFILSRVREAWKGGMSSSDAVAHGIKTTAGTITSAALIMVGVFAEFATQSGVEMQQMGIGLAFAVFVDATVIRGVLLPATMKLLGDWNWYLPRWLRWLPELDHEGPGATPPRTLVPATA
ncbi:MMPL family transporter [Solirubrobacter sp. CPCC 204708]|uniref:MMPL family transporter n=1 Tax=Solirubrobacter deserti TaxID=2282478 RepID=A0ABT4RS71_9ACTN|nr:MMPL family transporter [Solirubrobacter deserti]MBE2319903.1 MMPL family transporter [Solirubrobacter deserti]MDA0141435.1 MMPL family transporter [Solirubrobacter deserti]